MYEVLFSIYYTAGSAKRPIQMPDIRLRRLQPSSAHPGEDKCTGENGPARPRQPIAPAAIETHAVVDGHRGQQNAGDFLVFVPLRYGQFRHGVALHRYCPDMKIGIDTRIGAR